VLSNVDWPCNAETYIPDCGYQCSDLLGAQGRPTFHADSEAADEAKAKAKTEAEAVEVQCRYHCLGFCTLSLETELRCDCANRKLNQERTRTTQHSFGDVHL